MGQQQGGHVGTQLAFLGQAAVKRQHAHILLGGTHLEQRGADSAVGGGIHPGRHAHRVVDRHRLARRLEHQRFVRGGQLAANLIPGRFRQVAVGGEVGIVTDEAALLLRLRPDHGGVDADPLEHGVVGPAGMAVDAAEYHRHVLPAALIEALAETFGLFPVGRVHAADQHHALVFGAAGLFFRDQPLLELLQRQQLVVEVGAQAVECGHDRVAVGVDHPRHQHLAGEVDALRLSVSQRFHLAVAADLEDLAILDGDRLLQGLARFSGVDLGVGDDQVGGGHAFR